MELPLGYDNFGQIRQLGLTFIVILANDSVNQPSR